MIERHLVEEMFSEMQAEGVDTESEMLWGYYFADPAIEKIEAVVAELESLGFEFVEIFQTTPDDEKEEEFYVLHVERLESHTVDSLDKLNQQLAAFASSHGLDSYDGMDVSPLEEEDEDEEDDE